MGCIAFTHALFCVGRGTFLPKVSMSGAPCCNFHGLCQDVRGAAMSAAPRGDAEKRTEVQDTVNRKGVKEERSKGIGSCDGEAPDGSALPSGAS